MLFDVFDQRRIHVVVAQFVQAERFFADGVVFVERRKIPADHRHQIVVHAFVHVVRKQRRRAGRSVPADFGVGCVLIDIACVQRRDSPLVGRKIAVELLVGGAPDAAVRIFHQFGPGCLRQRNRAFRRFYSTKIQIRVGERRKRIAGSLFAFPQQGKHTLFFFAQDVRPRADEFFAPYAVQAFPVRNGGNERAQAVFRDTLHSRNKPAEFCRKRRVIHRDSAKAVQILRIAFVCGVFQMRIHIQPLQLPAGFAVK